MRAVSKWGLLGLLSVTAQATVDIEQGFVATPIPGTHLTAMYGTLINDGDDDIHITRVEADSSEAAELHEQTIDSADIVRMRRVAAMTIPAHGRLILRKGGAHLMLINLHKPLHDHDEVTITLYFERVEPQEITLPVLRAASQLDDA